MGKTEAQKTIIVMLGAPGAGKGTQAIQTSQAFDLPHISTGDILRENVKKGTELGKKMQSYLDEGKLGPDSLILGMLDERIKHSDCQKGFILDGFPRTITQAKALDETMQGAQILALNLDVPDAEIIRRIEERVVCDICGAPYDLRVNPPKIPGKCDRDGGALIKRKDDNLEVIKNRLQVYHKETAPVKDYYQQSNRLIDIDGTQEKTVVFSAIKNTINKFI